MEHSLTASIQKRKEKEHRKKEILNTAADLFARKGFHHVKMDEIAEEVGLSKGTLYLYFDNKEMLFISIITEKSDQLTEKLNNVLDCKKEYPECLKSFIQESISFFLQNRPYFKLLNSEKMSTSLEGHYKLHEYANQSMQSLNQLIMRIVKLGNIHNFFQNMKEPVIVKSLRGIMNSFLLDIIVQNDEVDIDTTVNDIFTVFLKGVQA